MFCKIYKEKASIFQYVTNTQTWNIWHTVVVLYRFLHSTACHRLQRDITQAKPDPSHRHTHFTSKQFRLNIKAEHSPADDTNFHTEFSNRCIISVRICLSTCIFTLINKSVNAGWTVCLSFMRNAGGLGGRDSLAGRLHTSHPSRTSSCDSSSRNQMHHWQTQCVRAQLFGPMCPKWPQMPLAQPESTYCQPLSGLLMVILHS